MRYGFIEIDVFHGDSQEYTSYLCIYADKNLEPHIILIILKTFFLLVMIAFVLGMLVSDSHLD